MSPHDIVVVEPQAADIPHPPHVAFATDIANLAAGFHPSVVVFAVKPQAMDAMIGVYARFAGAVFLSIAAGKTLGYFAARLGGEAAVVRAMPNTPAAVGQGMTVAVGNGLVKAEQRQCCDDLLSAVGDVAWIDDESLMDAVTAVSGSGPAYVFLLAECLAAAGKAAGLPDDLAERLARKTVIGAGELLRQSSDAPQTLRHAVTSPHGTTAAALAELTGDDGLAPLMTRAVAAASHRSRELAG